MLQRTRVKCSNGSEASEKNTRLLNDLKSPGNRILIFSDEKITPFIVFSNKQNYQIVTFGNDVPEHHRVSTTNYPA